MNLASVRRLVARPGAAARVDAVVPMRCGAVGTVVRARCADGRDLVVKSYPAALAHRAAVEFDALRALEAVPTCRRRRCSRTASSSGSRTW